MTRKAGNKAAPSSLSPSTTTTALPSTVTLPEVFTDGLPLPKLLAFDLDYTLWPAWVDTHITPPVKPVLPPVAAASESEAAVLAVRDRYGEELGFFADVGALLVAARRKGVQIAAASRTHAPEVAREVLRLLRVPLTNPRGSGGGGKDEEQGGDQDGQEKEEEDQERPQDSVRALDLFDVLEIYPGTKTTHFQRIHKKTGLPYAEMLFFDDESRNRNVESLGVVMRLVRDGVTAREVQEGVLEWRRRNGRTRKEQHDAEEDGEL